MYEQRLNTYYSLEREIANILIGSKIYRDRQTDAEYVENAIATVQNTLQSAATEADKIETIFLAGMLERVESYAGLFNRIVRSKRLLSELDREVHADVVRFGELNMEMHEKLVSLHEQAAQTQESHELLDKLIFSNSRLWGWFNRAVSVIDRDLLLANDISRFNVNSVITMQAYEKNIATIRELGGMLRIEGFDEYLEMLNKITRGLDADSVEFTIAAREDAQLAEQLEVHGTRLRGMMDRLIERSRTESRAQSDRLSIIFWTAAVVILVFSVLVSTWFSLSVSRPIKRLRENFKIVADGNFNLQVTAPGKGELDDLARAFNDMTDKLNKSYAEVEDCVRQRTRELQLATVRSKKLADAAQEANLSKSAFLATMSHEIRTPLNSIGHGWNCIAEVVVDHQVVACEMENGITASLTMTAFDCDRTIEIFGTKGCLRGGEPLQRSGTPELFFFDHYHGKTEEIPVEEVKGEGYASHGGGDFGIVDALDRLFAGPDALEPGLDGLAGHRLAYQAEVSRLAGGAPTS